MNLYLKHFCLLLISISLYSLPTKAQWMQWECRSNNSLSEFGNYLNDMKDRGYAPVNLNVVNYYNEPRVSSIWHKANINDWACWYGMNQQAFIEQIQHFNGRGLSPVDIAVWTETNGEARFAAIWQRINYEGVVEIGVSESALKNMILDYDKKGYSPKDINGYTSGNTILYTCIFDKEPRGQLSIAFGKSEVEFQQEFDQNTPLNYYPIDVSYFNFGNQILCNGIWAKNSQTWDSRKGYTEEEFQDYLDQKTDDGFVPVDIDQYFKDGKLYYGATLTKASYSNPISTPQYKSFHTSNTENNRLAISPVEQQTQVWCWLATGEMIFKHYGIPNLNPNGNFQCGIIGSIFNNSPCNSNCFNNVCIRGSGSNYNTVRMFKDYSWIAARKVFSCQEGYELDYSTIKSNIDRQKPILCGISPTRKQYYSGAEHVVVLTGYEVINQVPYIIINDPYPYPSYDNPYLKFNAVMLQKNQYRISLQSFTNDLFWHWSLSDIEID